MIDICHCWHKPVHTSTDIWLHSKHRATLFTEVTEWRGAERSLEIEPSQYTMHSCAGRLCFNSEGKISLLDRFELRFFCRETTFSGVKVFEYGLDDHSFDMRLRKNHCFCSKSDPSKCEGYTDLSPCFDGLPMALTFPHFYASGNLLRKVDGLQPGPDHVTKLLIEPNLGITMAAYVRMQINLVLEPFPVRGLRNLSPVVMPILWLEEVNI